MLFSNRNCVHVLQMAIVGSYIIICHVTTFDVLSDKCFCHPTDELIVRQLVDGLVNYLFTRRKNG